MTLLLQPQRLRVVRRTGASQAFDQTTFDANPETTTTFYIIGEIQPLQGLTRDDIPEGYRKGGTLKLYTSAKLRVISQELGLYSDIIYFEDGDGQSIAYEVFAEMARSGPFPVSHNRYTLLRVGLDEG